MIFKLSILATFASIVLGDDQFKSRPDLTVPIWNISSNYDEFKNQLSPGYIFVTPYSAATKDLDESIDQPGSYIYTNEGDLVWSSYGQIGGISLNFQASELYNEQILFAFEGQFSSRGGHGYGHIKILNDHYLPIKDIRGGDHQLIDIHEFQIITNKNGDKSGLIEGYSPIQYDLSEWNNGDKEKTWIVNTVVQEIDLSTNELLFEWKALDHISPSDSKTNLTSELAGDAKSSANAWDFFHINSVDKNFNGDYLISARHTSTIYKIDGKTGEILWKLSSDGDTDLEVIGLTFEFRYQHHARFLKSYNDIEIISFFDNHAYSKGHREPETTPNPNEISNGKIIKVNNKLKTVELIKQYNPPSEHLLSAKSQGSLQTLPDGNKLINWGSAGAITEYNHKGDVLFFAKLDSGIRGPYVQSYRAFKYNWVGYSSEEIAYTYKDGVIYISWNGDTITHEWEVVNSLTNESISRLKKTGFETVYEINIEGEFYINAIDEDGGIIKSSLKQIKSKKTTNLDYFNWRQYFLGNK